MLAWLNDVIICLRQWTIMSQSMNDPAGKFKLKVVKIKYLVNIQFSYFPDFQWRFTGLETFFFKFMTSRIRWISGNLWLLNISFFPSHSWCLIKSIKLKSPLDELFFTSPEPQKFLTSNFDSKHEIYLRVYAQNFKVTWPQLVTSSLVSGKQALKKWQF